MHLKLNELLAYHKRASNQLIGFAKAHARNAHEDETDERVGAQ